MPPWRAVVASPYCMSSTSTKHAVPSSD